MLSPSGNCFLRSVTLRFYLNDTALLMIKGTKLKAKKKRKRIKQFLKKVVTSLKRLFSIEVKAFPGIWKDVIWKKSGVPGEELPREPSSEQDPQGSCEIRRRACLLGVV